MVVHIVIVVVITLRHWLNHTVLRNILLNVGCRTRYRN